MKLKIFNEKRLREIGGILALLLAVLLLLSLLTYSPSDPSLNSTGFAVEQAPENAAGVFGSYVANILLTIAGVPSLLFPALLIILGVKLVRHQTVGRMPSRLFGAATIAIAAGVVLQLALPDVTYADFPAGGWIGLTLADFLGARFSLPGSLLICVATALIGVLFLTHIPLVDLIRRLFTAIGTRFRSLFERLSSRFTRMRSDYEKKKLRQEVRAKHAAQLDSIRKVHSLPVDDAHEDDEPAGPHPATEARHVHTRRLQPKSGAHRPVQEELPFPEDTRPRVAPANIPAITLLDKPPHDNAVDERELQGKAKLIEAKCNEFGIGGVVTEMHPGPVITTYEYQPNAGVKFSRIQGMSDDLSLALRAESVRIAKIPGRSTVGMEVPNAKREKIFLREIIDSTQFQRSTSRLPLALGKLSTGEAYIADLARMPHLLIAGATGMGKSVSLNSMILSILYRSTPEEVRLILVDPKRVELAIYADIPHLYCEVITESKKAVSALKNAVIEMEKRFKRLVRFSCRDIDGYNNKVRKGDYTLAPHEEKPQPLPYLVIIIDELADLMAELSMEVEHQIGRLAQMARAVGIHLVLATQRPSVDVITGTIKNNLPGRISFRVTQKIDSRTILDTSGGEQLLGNGDMLFLVPQTSRLLRVHGSYVSEEEIMRVVSHWKREARPQYNNAFLQEPEPEPVSGPGEVQDELFKQAVELVLSSGQASASHLQRRLKLGYNRAARLIDLMEEHGIVGPASGPNKSREILVSPDYLQTFAVRDAAGE